MPEYTEWLYHVESLGLAKLNDETLNNWGKLGWELVALDISRNSASFIAVFKMPRAEE